MNPILVYRGRFQQRRLELVVDALASIGILSLSMWWLAPQGEVEECEGFATRLRAARPNVDFDITVTDGRWRTRKRTLERLSSAGGHELLISLGSAAPVFVPRTERQRSVWLSQGIPEERLMPKATAPGIARCVVEWAAVRRSCPPVVITPTIQMAALIARRCPAAQTRYTIPNTAPLSLFEPSSDAGRAPHWVYLGSGAAWQEVSLLMAAWDSAAALDPDLRFTLVTRDQRARDAIPASLAPRVRTIGANGPAEVAAAMSDATLGFLLRADHLVNRAAWPVKFSEYLAAGVPVLTSDFDWDIADTVRALGCGTLVAPDATPHDIAVRALAVDPAQRVSASARALVSHDLAAARLGEILMSHARV